MRYLFGLFGAGALGALFIVGCTPAACEAGVCACTEEGIRAAIAAGGGPYKFDCGGWTPIPTQSEIFIDKDVALDGENNLAVEGAGNHTIFRVADGVTAELRGFTVTGDAEEQDTKANAESGVGIDNSGTLILANCAVSKNAGSGIQNFELGTLTLTNSTVSENGGGLFNKGTLMMTNSTVSADNTIINRGTLMMTNSTVSKGESQERISVINIDGTLGLTNCTLYDVQILNHRSDGSNTSEVTLAKSLVVGGCTGDISSDGYNIQAPLEGPIEMPDVLCDFDHETDQVLTEEQVNLGLLQENGGPTKTHKLEVMPAKSCAIDRIPVADCVDADGKQLLTDQRHLARPQGTECDVGAFERSSQDAPEGPDGSCGNGGTGGDGGSGGNGGTGGAGGSGGSGGSSVQP
jgi:uncharacterized membrane protein YgcG